MVAVRTCPPIGISRGPLRLPERRSPPGGARAAGSSGSCRWRCAAAAQKRLSRSSNWAAKFLGRSRRQRACCVRNAAPCARPARSLPPPKRHPAFSPRPTSQARRPKTDPAMVRPRSITSSPTSRALQGGRPDCVRMCRRVRQCRRIGGARGAVRPDATMHERQIRAAIPPAPRRRPAWPRRTAGTALPAGARRRARTCRRG